MEYQYVSVVGCLFSRWVEAFLCLKETVRKCVSRAPSRLFIAQPATVFLPDLCEIGSLYKEGLHNVNPRMFASATENLAGFAGPPTTKRMGSESAEDSRSGHCSKVFGNCMVE